MKTLRLFFLSLTVIAFGFFTSCTDETALEPTIDFVSGEGFVTGDATVEIDQSFSFKCLLTEGDAKLASFTIRLENADLTGYPLTDVASGDQDIFTTSQSEAGTYVYTFILTDNDDLKAEKSITITVSAAAATITTYTDKVLGASQNATGSSFASIDGAVYTLTQAAANSSKVDFVYFFGATNEASLAAPSNVEGAQAVYPSIADWATKNSTILEKTSLTAAAFDAVATDADITAPSGTATLVNHLAVGDVVAFKTATKKGLIKVTAITAENTGSISIVVKVQI